MDIIFDGTFTEIIINKDIKIHIKKICEKLFNNLKESNLLAPIDRKHFTAKTIRSNYVKVAKMNCVKTIYSNPLLPGIFKFFLSGLYISQNNVFL